MPGRVLLQGALVARVSLLLWVTQAPAGAAGQEGEGGAVVMLDAEGLLDVAAGIQLAAELAQDLML